MIALQERAAVADVDRRHVAEEARAFLGRPTLAVELERRALAVLVDITHGRERREVEARLRALAVALPPESARALRTALDVLSIDAEE